MNNSSTFDSNAHGKTETPFLIEATYPKRSNLYIKKFDNIKTFNGSLSGKKISTLVSTACSPPPGLTSCPSKAWCSLMLASYAPLFLCTYYFLAWAPLSFTVSITVVELSSLPGVDSSPRIALVHQTVSWFPPQVELFVIKAVCHFQHCIQGRFEPLEDRNNI